MEEKLVFTEDEWNAALPSIVQRMTDFLKPYRTQVYEHHGDYGAGLGSGSYIQFGKQVYILTNEHISRVRAGGKDLAHQFGGQDDIRPIIGNHIEFPAPFDVALLPVCEVAWHEATNESKAIAIEQIALAHTPAPGELFSFTGFSGDNVEFHFNTLCAEGTCHTAREIQLPQHPDIDPNFHFGLEYRPDLATSIIGTGGLPTPPGFSGSTIWNTAFVEAKMRGIPWSPDMARVTGILWGWPSGDGCLVGTRIEYLRSALLDAINTLSLKG